MDNISRTNGEQNERLALLEQGLKDFIVRFDDFKSNDFEHMRVKINWMFVFVVGALLVPIILYILGLE